MVLVVLVVIGSACAAPPSDTTATEASRIITAERIAAPEGVRAWNLRYRSETVSGDPTEVTGWVAIPDAPDGMPILAWAHPTSGLDDQCAPSLGGGPTPFHFEAELASGWAIVATDYEGLGGPGLHPYLVSESEARSIFDLARAARELESGVDARIALWGFSQGGHAALAAAGLAPELAPEFEVLGAAAVAPAVDLIGWAPAAVGTVEQGYVVAILRGFAAAYHLDISEILTERAMELLPEVETSCSDPTLYAISGLAGSETFRVDPSTTEPWAGLLIENSPELHTIGVPVLLVVGTEDRLWDIGLLDVITERMCGIGTPVATSIHLGEDHLSVNGAARGAIVSFLEDRRSGEAFESEC